MRLILVLDDLPEAIALFEAMLKRFDFQVMSARNGVEGLHLLDTVSAEPSLIISDLQMPQMDGLNFLQHLREHPDWQSIPFVLTTAYITPETAKLASEHGSDGLLPKPFTVAALKSLLIEIGVLPSEA